MVYLLLKPCHNVVGKNWPGDGRGSRGLPTMDFLGVHLTKDGATVDPAKIARIADWPENITTLKGARSFIGVLGYHHMFITGFSSITAPITCLFGKDVPFK